MIIERLTMGSLKMYSRTRPPLAININININISMLSLHSLTMLLGAILFILLTT